MKVKLKKFSLASNLAHERPILRRKNRTSPCNKMLLLVHSFLPSFIFDAEGHIFLGLT